MTKLIGLLILIGSNFDYEHATVPKRFVLGLTKFDQIKSQKACIFRPWHIVNLVSSHRAECIISVLFENVLTF